MAEEKAKRHSEKCYNCSGQLELYEMDLQRAQKIMFCRCCGLFHYYSKDFLGSLKLRKVSKTPEIPRK